MSAFWKTLLVAVTAAFLPLAGAWAQVAYQQPAAAGSSGYLSATFTPDGSNGEEFVWDSFSVATTQTIREIQWRGVRGAPSPVDFQISLNTLALPGGTVWSTGGNATETATGIVGVYDYKFTLPAGFTITGGTTYWLNIYAKQTPNFDWQWNAGTGGNGTHTAQVPAITGNYRYISTPGDVAFSLRTQATVPVTISVARSPAAGGTTTGGGTFAPGTNVTVTATPAAGRAFLNWTDAGVVVSTMTSYSFAADGNKTLTANFSGANTGPYVISAVANPSVYGNVNGDGTYGAGEIVDLDISAADGVSFVGWTENGVLVNLPFSNGVFQITASANRNLVANFSYPANSMFINGVVSPVGTGTIVIAGTAGLSSGSYNGGTLITLNATPVAGYHVAYWRQGAGLGDLSGAPHVVGTDPSHKHMVCYGTTLTAVFEPNNPVLTLSAVPVAGGTITGAGTYAHGANVTVTATPAIGYTFVNWKQGTTIKSADASYTFPLTNHTALTATFLATNRTITATAAPAVGGSVTGAGVVGNGASATLTATPAPGYVFENWMLGGNIAATAKTISFIADADYTFVANFTPFPTLAIANTATPGQLLVAWPGSATGWTLQESPDLVAWVPSARAITNVGGQKTVTVIPVGASAFFRLTHP